MIRKNFLPVSKPSLTKDEINAVREVLKSGWWTTGPKVSEFEKELTKYLQETRTLYAAALNSCTAGLHLSLLALDIKKGDEVIVPTWTFAATAQVVEWIGARLVLCDVEEGSLNIDLKKAERLITPKTRAIIPVHFAGYPCDIDALLGLSKKYNIRIIEDAAHAIGTRYKGIKIGNFSDAVVFSFYATKNLAMGEGGAVVSKDREFIERVRRLSYFGINKEAFKRYEKTGIWFYDIEGMGYKYNLDSIKAAVGLAQLKRLDEMNERRREIAERYRESLDKKIIFTEDSSEHYHTYHLFAIRVLKRNFKRDLFIEELKRNNIGTSVHFIPLHLHSFYKNRFLKRNFPIANTAYKQILSIPMFPSMTDADTDYVITTINNLLKRS